MEGHNVTQVSLTEVSEKVPKWHHYFSEKSNRGEDKYSTCQMYDVNFEEINDWDYKNWNYSEFSKSGENVVMLMRKQSACKP